MAHITKVNGTAYEISGGKTKVNGTGYGIKGGKTRVNGTAYDISFNAIQPNFADNDWVTIIAACQNNEVPDTWAVGNQKAMTIGGVSYNIDIIGKNHDVYSDGSGTAPLTFQLHDPLANVYYLHTANSNYSGWEGCSMRTSTLPSILATFPTEIKTAIKQVTKTSSKGNGSATTKTTSDKLFLLSGKEIAGASAIKGTAAAEGQQYKYYADGNSPRKSVTVSGKLYESWWTRSVYLNSGNLYLVMNRYGALDTEYPAGNCAVVPAFCF